MKFDLVPRKWAAGSFGKKSQLLFREKDEKGRRRGVDLSGWWELIQLKRTLTEGWKGTKRRRFHGGERRKSARSLLTTPMRGSVFSFHWHRYWYWWFNICQQHLREGSSAYRYTIFLCCLGWSKHQYHRQLMISVKQKSSVDDTYQWVSVISVNCPLDEDF